MLRLQKIAISPEELFSQRYEKMLGWSLHLTGGDRGRAEDLLHDLFVLFALRQPDLAAIENLDGYLYTMLRNLHLSQVRRASRLNFRQLSVVDYDSAESGLRTIDALEQIQAQDDLRKVCRFLCARKERAKAASVLILRFFHGYYPSEIATLLNTTRPAVDVRMSSARNEAKLFLENPRSLGLLGGERVEESRPSVVAQAPQDILCDLRQIIFDSRRGECLTATQLRSCYETCEASSFATASLAHLVSCAACLDEANRLLGLPLLAERYPLDTLVRSARGKDKDDGTGGDPPTGGAMSRRKLGGLRRRAAETFEQKPSELCVSVNGYVQGSQRVNSEFNELKLVVDMAEPIRFVEIFSEQQTRLLFLEVELPPEGDSEQPLNVELSDGRTLDLSLKFCSPWPTVQVCYRDPSYKFLETLAAEMRRQDTAAAEPVTEVTGDAVHSSPTAGWPGWLAQAARKLFSARFWLRPVPASAVLSLILIASLLYVRTSPRAVSATDLLARAAEAEKLLADRADTVSRRVVELEEVGKGGEVIARRKIEVWRSAEKRLAARRLYDERGKLIAGEWRRSGDGGTSTIYHHPLASRAGAEVEPEALSLENLWRFEPSANDFTTLVGGSGGARAVERDDAYVLTHSKEDDGATQGLIEATLVLNRSTLRAVKQTLLVRRGAGTHEYRFTEAAFEQKPKGLAPEAAFEPDAEFFKVGVTRTIITPGAEERPASPSEPQKMTALSMTASSELEVEVLRLLNQAGADLGEQVSVTRTQGGILHVRGIVETQYRKGEIMRALSPVRENPMVKIEVNTAGEELKLRGGAQAAPAPAVVQHVEPSEDRMPADAELRRYFTKEMGLSDERAGEAVLGLAGRVSARSRNALQHAWAIKRLAGRFSAQELGALDTAARAKWFAMLRQHARMVKQESAQLRRELQPIFSPSGGSTYDVGAAGVEMNDEAGLVKAAEALVALCAANDSQVRSAFSLSSDGAAAANAVKSTQFWRALMRAEMLAGRIEGEAHKIRIPPGAKSTPAPSPQTRESRESQPDDIPPGGGR
ncbi:MAG TPA: sigma-70 family RNA polymerase sigma factor [Pyrinomonadaceae bacterium]